MIDWKISPFDRKIELEIPDYGVWTIIKRPEDGHFDVDCDGKKIIVNKYRLVDTLEAVKKTAIQKVEEEIQKHEDRTIELKSILNEVESLTIFFDDEIFYPIGIEFSKKFLEFLFFHRVINRCEKKAMEDVDVRSFKFNEQPDKRYYCLYRIKLYKQATFGEYATYDEVKVNYLENFSYSQAECEACDVFVYDLEKDKEIHGIKIVVEFEEENDEEDSST